MEWNLDKVDFEMVEILVIVEKPDFKFFWMKFLDTVDFFEIVDNLLLMDESTFMSATVWILPSVSKCLLIW